ncbi:MAG: hypothetical protein Q4E03_02475 [Trueperella sp.]|nr:hypothetical protein [Trueperella sp.]
MAMNQPRRPAQLRPEQIELIEGEVDTAATSELAHTTAQAVVLPRNPQTELEPQAAARIQEIIAAEGIDSIAETWANSPHDSLPGVLWRGYLLREWVRRFGTEVELRFAAAQKVAQQDAPEKLTQVSTPAQVRAQWDTVLRGNFTGDFAAVLRESARFTDFLGAVEPLWIEDEEHPLATQVTIRDTAMLRTSAEFRDAGELQVRGLLQ